MALPTLVTFILYLIAVFAIGWWAYRLTHNLSDYILGGRRLGPAVTALSAGASDMSGWLLLGLPGAIYLTGLQESWIIVGLSIGAWCNWRFIAQRLRSYTETSGDALTLPDFFDKRFRDQSRSLRIIAALIILTFFTFYTASGLVAGAKLFASSFALNYYSALLIGAFVIVSYTCAGGFLAVSWTDFAQSLLMLFALIAVPLMILYDQGGISPAITSIEIISPEHLNLFEGLSAISFFSLMAWGLGYFGQPHILARFMAIRSAHEIPKARKIGMTWMVFTLVAAVLVGMGGLVEFAGTEQETVLVTHNETVFILLTQHLFNPWIAGILLAAILAAIMSTIDSQLLVSSSAVTGDLYRGLLRPKASEKELLWVSRLTVLLISLVAIAIASDPDNQVLSLVSYAWAGCGASFGPVIVLSLFWRKMTRNGALAGMIVGAVTVIVWKHLQGGIFDLYELLPAFLLGVLTIVIVSKIDQPVSQEIDEEFELVMNKQK
ncbi:MAG: sodium/proline symporter PutP [Oligoflexus sp.]